VIWVVLLVVAGGPVEVKGDATKGEAVYARCLACHALDYDRTGPHHCGVVGRKAGTVKEFQYSDAMKKSGLTWNVKTLNRFLSAPTEVVPGTAMTYAGVPDDQERADLIAWLAQQKCKPASK
jgi:cytochrome c